MLDKSIFLESSFSKTVSLRSICGAIGKANIVQNGVVSGNRVPKGREYEAMAADYLRAQGYTIVTRNFTIRGGEIDIIALDAEELVFVEVRWRTDDEAEWSVTEDKVDAIRRAATAYLSEMPEARDYRFDFIAIGPRGLRHTERFL